MSVDGFGQRRALARPGRWRLDRSLLVVCVLWPLALGAQTPLESFSAAAPKLPPTDPRVQRVEAIVTRLLAVSPYALVGPSWQRALHVLDVRHGPGFGGARMLPDGILVVDRRLVELAEQGGAGRGRGEVLLAFVLAHELMHLLDLSERELAEADDPAADAFRERTADVRAVQLMAFAGYDIDALLAGIEGFLGEWARISGVPSLDAETHGRHQLVRDGIARIRENLITFRAGLRLYERGEFLDAEALLTSYARAFPAPEARHARGLAALQLVVFVLRHRVPVDRPGAAFARGCWPLPVPERSPRAQPVGHVLPVGVSPTVERIDSLLDAAIEDFDAADKGYGRSPEIRIARAFATLLRGAHDAERALAQAAAALDEVEVVLAARAPAPATRARLALARSNLAFARGRIEEGHRLRSAADRPEAPVDVSACLACALDASGTPIRCESPDEAAAGTLRASEVTTSAAAPLPGIALGQTIDEVFTALGVQDARMPRRQIDISIGSLTLVHLPRVSLRPGERGAVDLAFTDGELVMAQWMPEEPRPCSAWPDARVVGQLGSARALLRDGAGLGQQCVGDRLIVSYLFRPARRIGDQP